MFLSISAIVEITWVYGVSGPRSCLCSPIRMIVVYCRRMSLVNRPSRQQSVVANMGAVEVAQVAGEAGYIGGVAGVMFGITLVGLALGFVLLRVESLAEEGKI